MEQIAANDDSSFTPRLSWLCSRTFDFQLTPIGVALGNSGLLRDACESNGKAFPTLHKMSAVVLLLTTFPDIAVARPAVRTLVEEQLVACGNILPSVESIYRWQGTVETSAEVMVFFKTTVDCADAAQARLRDLHPYEVPEILRLPVDGGWPPYLDWVRNETNH